MTSIGALLDRRQRFGDVLGTNLYDHFGGFTVCVIAITVVYALILPMLLLVPKNLIAPPTARRRPAGSTPPDHFRGASRPCAALVTEHQPLGAPCPRFDRVAHYVRIKHGRADVTHAAMR